MSTRLQVWLLFAAAAAVIAATGHKLQNELVWDDLYVIAQGQVIHDGSNLPDVFLHRTMYVSSATDSAAEEVSGLDTWRPITIATFMWDSALSGRDPWAYHVTNAILHLGCMLLLFLLARRLLPGPRAPVVSLFVAAWLGLTPLLAEAHVWINGRSDPACTLFGLAALLAWRHGLDDTGLSARRRKLAVVGSAVLFLVGLLCKEVLLFTLPAVVLWPEPDPRQRTTRRRLVRAAGLIGAGAVYLAARAIVLGGLRGHGGRGHLAAAAVRLPALLLDGIAELLVPTRVYVRSMSDDYAALGLWPLLALGLPVVAAAVVLIARRRTLPLLSWGMLWFACTLAPAALIAVLLWPGFGRYLYLPAVGASIGLGALVCRALEHPALQPPRARRWLVVLAVIYLGALGARLHAWTSDFRDEEALYQSIIDAAPDRGHGYGWLGMTRVEQGRPAEAIPLLARADQLSPHQSRYLRQLGWALLSVGEAERALDVAATGIGRYDDDAQFHRLAARVLWSARPELAAGHLVECVRQRGPSGPCAADVRDASAEPTLGATYRALFAEAISADPELAASLRPLLQP